MVYSYLKRCLKPAVSSEVVGVVANTFWSGVGSSIAVTNKQITVITFNILHKNQLHLHVSSTHEQYNILLSGTSYCTLYLQRGFPTKTSRKAHSQEHDNKLVNLVKVSPYNTSLLSNTLEILEVEMVSCSLVVLLTSVGSTKIYHRNTLSLSKAIRYRHRVKFLLNSIQQVKESWRGPDSRLKHQALDHILRFSLNLYLCCPYDNARSF